MSGGREVVLGGWRRYRVDPGTGVHAVDPWPGTGLRLELDGREVAAADLALVAVEQGPGDQLRWQRADGAGALVVDVTATGDAAAGVVRTVVTVSGRGRLTRVDVDGPEGGPGMAGPDGPGLGQPTLGEGWWAALCHPGAEGFGLAVDADLGRGPLTLPPFVVGRAEPGRELASLWDEVDRVRPRPPSLVVLANNWYQLGYAGLMDHGTVTAELSGFAAVAARHGLPLDFYCLDDPWDGEWAPASGLWGRLAPGRFPGGLEGLLGHAPAGGGVGGLGLWVSPWGGYFDRHDQRVTWGRDNGLETEEGPPWDRLCPAGDAYASHLAESLAAHTRAGVRYWKLDGVQFDCRRPDHGHPVGPGGRTHQMDRFAALLDGIRAVDPGVVLAFTTGSNPSPWWLRHADFIWRGGLDDDAPESYDGGRHERFATYIDGCLDALRHTTVPVSAVVTFSVVENGARAYRDEGEGPKVWERHCWLMVGRGTHHHDLYVAPDSLSDGEWAALGRALAWGRANQAVLARSRMIGGHPQAGEPYGFLSSAGGRVVLCLRNPRAAAQAMALVLDEGAVDLEPVWGRASAVPARLAAGARADLELEPFEVVVVSGRSPGRTAPGPRG